MTTSLSNTVKSLCLKEGFFKVGFAKYELLTSEAAAYKKWVGENRNAGMNWMPRNIEKREDVSLILDGVKSVISLAYIYDTPFTHNENTPKISRYAWGENNYHKIIKKKLKNICDALKNLDHSIETKFYVDDGPVLEKAWAARSGIGWVGKHGNVINQEAGSFFFLSEIFINKELDYDTPVENLCETCRICMEACPTGAIYDEYKVDANLCISYHTIENRNEIPSYIEISGWIFGCDICQDVCPFNMKKFFTDNPAFFPLKEIHNSSLNDLGNINEEEFNNLFKNSPVKRTKFSGWKRNLTKYISETK